MRASASNLLVREDERFRASEMPKLLVREEERFPASCIPIILLPIVRLSGCLSAQSCYKG
jgi:hypothetical protein